MVAHRGNPGITLSDPWWLAAFRINERKVKDYGRGRVAGDAALDIHSLAGGQHEHRHATPSILPGS